MMGKAIELGWICKEGGTEQWRDEKRQKPRNERPVFAVHCVFLPIVITGIDIVIFIVVIIATRRGRLVSREASKGVVSRKAYL